jgi:DNA-binding winged helix-turn-helix (wHTH) protein
MDLGEAIMQEFPPFRLDPVNQCLWRDRETVVPERILLPPKAFAVLCYLVAHAGRLVTQEELLEAVWPETYVQPEVLRNHIFTIRRALGDSPTQPRFLETLARRGYRFLAAVRDSSVAEPTEPTPPAYGTLVGRGHWLGELRGYLQLALRAQRQIVFVTGEPGIGKTALVDAFQQQATAEVPSLRLARGQCLEGYGGMEAYYPMLEALGQLCRGAGGDAVVELLATHAPTWLVQFPALMTRAHRDTLQRELLGATRERMLREIAEALETLTADRPLLLIFEDLQWVDHATVDLLAALARRRTPAQLLLVATSRPMDLALGDHPLQALTQELRVHQLCHDIALEPLSEADVAAYLTAAAAGTPLPEGLVGLVYRHSEGNPLFMRAVLDHLTQQGLLAREADGWDLRMPIADIALGVPESLRQMIDAQIARLHPEEQRVLEIASVAGTVFTASVCAAAAHQEPELFEALCETLARRRYLVRTAGPHQVSPDGSLAPRYAFVHALYREVCYGRQAPGRRATLHRRLGERMERVFATQLRDVAAELAYHLEAGAAWAHAITYLRLVADTAERRCRGRARRGWPRSTRASPPTAPPGQHYSSHTCAPCWRTSLPAWATRQTVCRHWPRPTPWWSSRSNATGKRKSIASGVSCSCVSRGHRRQRRKPGCSAPWMLPTARRRKRWSCEPP